MVIVRFRTYRKLMFDFALLGIIISAYIYIVHMYIRDKKLSSKDVHLTFVYQSDIIYLNNSGIPDSNINDDVMIPGQYAWIPYPVKRIPSGPFIINKTNGEEIKYTNYSFYPLTFNSRFLINNPYICKDTNNLTFLIMVHTAVSHFYRRKALRETWANPRLLKIHFSRILFLVGKNKRNTYQKALEIESEKYNDIVQGDFIDDYHNLTHKGILGFRWIVEYCQNVKLILKVDDDVFVNIFLLIHKLLPKCQSEPRTIMCRLLVNEPIAREGTYAVDPDYFPGYKRSPIEYCPGPFVLMCRYIVPEMYEAAKSTPFYWIDDFYLFGVLPNQIRNVTFHVVGNVDNSETNALQCFQRGNPCTYLAAYAWTQGVMYKYWDATLHMYKDLAEIYAN